MLIAQNTAETDEIKNMKNNCSTKHLCRTKHQPIPPTPPPVLRPCWTACPVQIRAHHHIDVYTGINEYGIFWCGNYILFLWRIVLWLLLELCPVYFDVHSKILCSPFHFDLVFLQVFFVSRHLFVRLVFASLTASRDVPLITHVPASPFRFLALQIPTKDTIQLEI